jgi:hypothetical protein
MSLFNKSIVKKCSDIFKELDSLPIESKVEIINEIRVSLHRHSPFSQEPVDCVLWVPLSDVQANDYNPNSVAPPEMKLLAHSIKEDGYTQPIVSWKNENKYEVVDGYHRNRVAREIPEVRERINGYLPLTVINDARMDRGDRIAATIRHNRARGKHRIDAMSDIVVELKRRNWSDDKIGRDLGMDPDEVLRLVQITGLADMFANREFSKAWEAEESTEINQDDNIETNAENLSSLPNVGGLEGRNVSRDTVRNPTDSDRGSGEAPANAGPPKGSNAKGDDAVANRKRGKSKQSGKKSSSVARTSGVLPCDDHTGLPYETGVAHPKSKPAGRCKRGGRFSNQGVD